jgi:acyl-CoA thioesterase-1
MEGNLAGIIEKSQAAGAAVLLIGMRIPPNYGRDYTAGFEAIYTRLAAKYRLPLVPFLLDGIADNDALMLSDRIHPNREAQAMVLENVWPTLKSSLQAASRTVQR